MKYYTEVRGHKHSNRFFQFVSNNSTFHRVVFIILTIILFCIIILRANQSTSLATASYTDINVESADITIEPEEVEEASEPVKQYEEIFAKEIFNDKSKNEQQVRVIDIEKYANEYTNDEEEIAQEPIKVRENTLYYVVDEGYVYYCNTEYQDYLYLKLKEYGYTELYKVCLAQMYHESKFVPTAVSATDDHGLMQINAGNFNWLSNDIGISSIDDPYQNIDCGLYILISAYEEYNDIEAALVCYNQGYVGQVRSTKYSRGVIADMEKLFVWEDYENVT